MATAEPNFQHISVVSFLLLTIYMPVLLREVLENTRQKAAAWNMLYSGIDTLDGSGMFGVLCSSCCVRRRLVIKVWLESSSALIKDVKTQ